MMPGMAAKEEPPTAPPLPKLETAKAVSAAEMIIEAMLNAESENADEANSASAVAAVETGEGDDKAADAGAATYGERFRAAPEPKQKSPKKPRMKWGAPTSRILRNIINPGAKDFVEKKAEELEPVKVRAHSTCMRQELAHALADAPAHTHAHPHGYARARTGWEAVLEAEVQGRGQRCGHGAADK